VRTSEHAEHTTEVIPGEIPKSCVFTFTLCAGVVSAICLNFVCVCTSFCHPPCVSALRRTVFPMCPDRDSNVRALGGPSPCAHLIACVVPMARYLAAVRVLAHIYATLYPERTHESRKALQMVLRTMLIILPKSLHHASWCDELAGDNLTASQGIAAQLLLQPRCCMIPD
jgi:hypothetical protein